MDIHPSLLKEAEHLFNQHGYLSTTLDDIQQAANVPAGRLQKEDLLWQSAVRIADAFSVALEKVLAEPRPVDDRLRHAIMAHINVIVDNLAAANVYMHEWRYLTPVRQHEYRQRRDAYEAQFREIVKEGIHAGVFAPVDEKLVTLMLLSSLNWVSQWYNPSGELTPIDIAHTLADLTLNGLYRHV